MARGMVSETPSAAISGDVQTTSNALYPSRKLRRNQYQEQNPSKNQKNLYTYQKQSETKFPTKPFAMIISAVLAEWGNANLGSMPMAVKGQTVNENM